MRFTQFPALILAFAAASGSWAADIENGKQLHQGCTQCHGTEAYTRENRRVTDLNKLQNQVQRCALALGKVWSNEDVDDVTAYLNAEYYKF